jgi:hypothetical protein
MVPTWKKDLDALVTETIAFAASVNEKKRAQPKQVVDLLAADTTVFGSDAKDEVVQADLPVLATVEAILAQEPIAPDPIPEETNEWPARLPPLTLPPSERDEIKQRLANFKAHQLRMQAEREDYYLQTMTRTRAVAAGSLPTKNQ